VLELLAILAKEYLRSSLGNRIATAGNLHEEIVFHWKIKAFHGWTMAEPVASRLPKYLAKMSISISLLKVAEDASGCYGVRRYARRKTIPNSSQMFSLQLLWHTTMEEHETDSDSYSRKGRFSIYGKNWWAMWFSKEMDRTKAGNEISWWAQRMLKFPRTVSRNVTCVASI
jgi:hypothetical protein